MESARLLTEAEEEELIDVCGRAFNGDVSDEKLEDGGGGGHGEMKVLSLSKPGPSMTIAQLDEHSKQRVVIDGLNDLVRVIDQVVAALDKEEMSLVDGISLISSGDFSAMAQAISGLKDYQLCGLFDEEAAQIVNDKKSRVVVLHHSVPSNRLPWSHSNNLLIRLARESPASLSLVEMVNQAPRKIDETYGLWKVMAQFRQDIKVTARCLGFIGKIFLLKYGTRLPVAATNTALSQLDSNDLLSLGTIVDLHSLAHPLRAIITGRLGDWSSFCLMDSVPEAVSRTGASKAWSDFQTAHPDLANQAQAYAGQEAAKQMAYFRAALGVQSSTGAVAVALQSKLPVGGSSGEGGSVFKPRPPKR